MTGIAWFMAALLAIVVRPVLAADVPGTARPEADSAQAARDPLTTARALARQVDWIPAERAARQVLLAQPILNPDLGVVDEAFDLVLRARTAIRPTRSESLAALASIDSLAARILRNGHITAGRRMVERSVMLRRSSPEDLDPAAARAQLLLGNAAHWLGENELALRHLEEARAAYVRIEGPGSEGAHAVLLSLSSVHGALGDLATARRLYEQCIAFFETRPASVRLGIAYQGLGSLLMVLSDPLGARRAVIRCIEIRTSLGLTGWFIGDPLGILADTHLMTGENERALALADSAAALIRSSEVEETRRAELTLLRAQALLAVGRFGEAEDEARRSLALSEAQPGPEDRIVDPLVTIARILSARGDWHGASELFERCVQINGRSLPPDHPRQGRDLLALARARLALGDSAHALHMALDAHERWRKHLLLTAPGLTGNGAVRYDTQRAQALHVAIAAVPDRPEPADLRDVLDAVVQTRAIVFELQSMRLHAWGDSTIDSLRVAYEQGCTRLANLMVRGPGDAPEERWRAVLNSTRAARERAELALAQLSVRFSLDHAALAVGLDAVERAKPRGSALVAFVRHTEPLSRPGVSRPGAVATPVTVVPGLEKLPGSAEAVGAWYSAFVVSADGRITLHRLGEARVIDAAVLRWREEASAAGRTAVESEYRRVAGRVRELVWDPVARDLDGARSVYVVPDAALHLVNFAALPAPASGYLLEHEPRIVHLSAERDIAQGSLGSVGTGPEPRTEHGEADSATVAMQDVGRSVSASTHAGALPENSTMHGVGGLLVVGGPEFDSDMRAQVATPAARGQGEAEVHAASGRLFRSAPNPCPRFAELRLSALPGTLSEAREVASLWRRGSAASSGLSAHPATVTFLTGAQATEEKLKRLAPGREALHVATHGYFFEAACDTGAGNSESAAAYEGALMRSGLALAGFNRRRDAPADGEDGALTAEEVAAMDLRSVRCVVLSTCESGVGDVVPGEGVFGLRRAFRLAGARTLVSSLWKIEDQAARFWSESFHRSYLAGASPSDAAAAASRAMLQRARARGDGGHPHAWGAFVAYGDRRQ